MRAGSGLRGGLRELTRDHRAWLTTGLVTEIDRPAGEAPSVVVELADGRPVECRPVYLPGDYTPHEVGDEVVVLFPDGETGGALVLGRPVGGQQLPPDEVDDGGRHLFADKVEVRSATGQDVDGVVLRALLDDLSDVVTGLQAVVTALANPATPPGTAVQNAAILTAMRTAETTAGLGTKIATLSAGLSSSKAGQGAAPYCSPVLRATDGT